MTSGTSSGSNFPFYQVNVFSEDRLLGNPVAVVIVPEDASEKPSDQRMQEFARWTNLSETTFLFPESEEVDYTLRIFTPVDELPFAGHPTLGSCKAWIEYCRSQKRQVPTKIIQKCQIGKVNVRIDEEDQGSSTLSLECPPLLAVDQADEGVIRKVCDCMGIGRQDVVKAQWVKTGDVKLFVELKNAEAVKKVKIVNVSDAVKDLIWGIYGKHSRSRNSDDAEEPLYEVRLFAPIFDIAEDPITGSFHAALALLVRDDAPRSYCNTQGSMIGRNGKVFVRDEGASVWIGGKTQACIAGRVTI